MQTKEISIDSGPTKADFLQRRDRTTFVASEKPWDDYRAWLISCSFHTLLIVTCAFLWRPHTRGTGAEPDRPVGIAIVHQTQNGDEYYLQGGAKSSKSSSKSQVASTAVATADGAGPPIALSEVLSALTGSDTNDSGQENGIGQGLTGLGNTGPGNSKAGRNPTKASFFGTEGTGQSFVYVVDRSDSMKAYDAAPLRYAKRELIKSFESLNEYHQFQIIFYNESPSPPLTNSGSMGRMLFATDSDKKRAARYVRAMPGNGGTEHLPAIRLGLSMAPDVLFFLTDAEDPRLSMNQLLEIQRLAETKGTSINTIQFSVGPDPGGGGWIRDLAEMNRGSYRYLDVTTFDLPEEPDAKE